MEESTLTITANEARSDLNNMTIAILTDAAQTTTPGAEYDETTNTLNITIDSDATDLTLLTAVRDAIELETEMGGFDAEVSSGTNGRQNVTGVAQISGTDNPDIAVTGTTGTSGGGVIGGQLVMQISGFLGTEIFNFEANTTVATIVDAINLVSDATGVVASISSESGSEGNLVLNSAGYGSKHFVEVEVIEEGVGGGFESGLSTTRVIGTNIQAAVNGVTASGDGNTLSINTATLDLSATITAGTTSTISFTIEEGGALFQLGPDVVSNQQARIGIGSLSTAKLRGESGRLYELGTGQDAALATNSTLAASIVDEVVTKIASLRGKLGAFQKTTLDANLNSLTDTMENLTAAESIIRDADFAAETAELTRAQILVQSGTSVLAIANSNPQNILALLR